MLTRRESCCGDFKLFPYISFAGNSCSTVINNVVLEKVAEIVFIPLEGMYKESASYEWVKMKIAISIAWQKSKQLKSLIWLVLTIRQKQRKNSMGRETKKICQRISNLYTRLKSLLKLRFFNGLIYLFILTTKQNRKSKVVSLTD